MCPIGCLKEYDAEEPLDTQRQKRRPVHLVYACKLRNFIICALTHCEVLLCHASICVSFPVIVEILVLPKRTFWVGFEYRLVTDEVCGI